MIFNQHFGLANKHSFLSGSSYAWTNYDPEKLRVVYINNLKKQEGTALHELASELIVRRIKTANLKKAFNQFVNDSIGFRMESEQILYYSDNCFGTADAILFQDNHLRIFDLKTGFSKPSFKQLEIYTAMFCLEYDENPNEITVEHRIYQGNGFTTHIPDPNDVIDIMHKIVEFDKVIEQVKEEL